VIFRVLFREEFENSIAENTLLGNEWLSGCFRENERRKALESGSS
jgi:hypothetical protein